MPKFCVNFAAHNKDKDERQLERTAESKDGSQGEGKVRKEKLASLFFDLAKLTYTALVLGAIVLFFQNDGLSFKLGLMLAVGVILAFAWAEIGNNILK